MTSNLCESTTPSQMKDPDYYIAVLNITYSCLNSSHETAPYNEIGAGGGLVPGPEGKMVWKDETTAAAEMIREGKAPKLGRNIFTLSLSPPQLLCPFPWYLVAC